MPIAARRVFRLSLTVALSLAAAYGLGLSLPFLAPMFAFLLTAPPKPPLGLRGTLGLALAVAVTLGLGLLLTPLLTHYTVAGLLLVLAALFVCNYVTLILGKGLVGTLLTVGVALISTAGVVSQTLATALVAGMVTGVVLAVICQWIVYPLFPEDEIADEPAPAPAAPSRWLALRATLIVYPGFLLALSNPAAYLATVMKTVALGQQASSLDARGAGRELLGSTFVAGLLAILFWFGLKIAPSLWMFFLWMWAFGLYIAAKLYGVSPSRYPPSFWQNVMITLLILLGPAVADSANGKDVYKAFAMRMSLFVAVTVYAWMAVVFLDHVYLRGLKSREQRPSASAARAGAR